MAHQIKPTTWRVGSLTFHGPVQVEPGRWCVTCDDDLTGEHVAKHGTLREMQTLLEIATGGKPRDELAQQYNGQTITGRQSTDTHGNVLNARAAMHASGQQISKPGRPGARDKFNLRAVADVLADYELDPIAEIAKVLKEKVAKGGVETYAVRGVDRAKVLTELAQYVRPKLKAVEMKVEDNRSLTDDQIDQRLAALLTKDAKAADALLSLANATKEQP
jgi:hypothetical protein